MFTRSNYSEHTGGLVSQKLKEVTWPFLLLIAVVAGFGFVLLFSAANGQFDPWASRQIVRFVFGLIILLAVAVVDIRVWMSLAYPAYAVTLVALVAVEFIGVKGMGAQRWLDLGPFVVQPSEFMKIAMVLALARHLHSLTLEQVSRPVTLLPSLFMIVAPVALVLKQPDLGTAMLLLAGGCIVLFIAGLSWRIVIAGVVASLGALVVGWRFLAPYQKQRVLTFLDPENDPMGSGYHILQSKIAFGSGGVFGKGFLEGTQNRLDFLPEKHTDFIFVTLGEEFGLLGTMSLLFLYFLIVVYGLRIALSSENQFGRLLAMGVLVTFILYIIINTGMVMGLLPVVGVSASSCLLWWHGDDDSYVRFWIGDVRLGSPGRGRQAESVCLLTLGQWKLVDVVVKGWPFCQPRQPRFEVWVGWNIPGKVNPPECRGAQWDIAH